MEYEIKVQDLIEHIRFGTQRKYDIKNYVVAIEGLLNLYNKEKEKNKELEDADLTTVYMNGFYDGEKKWKDKIKEKMRYYQELYKQDNSPNEFLIGQDCLSKLSFSQELLEERN